MAENKSCKVALVTGGNRGIGFAIVESLARLGNIRVLMGSRDLTLGEKAADSFIKAGLDVLPVQLDLTKKTSVEALIEFLIKEYDGVDILINNAGILEKGNVLDVSDEAFDTSMLVNFRMLLHLIRKLTPGMITRGFGRIVNMSSGLGSFAEGLNGSAAYSISKAALNALTLVLSHELPANVKVNSMCPGWVHTRMGGENAPRTPEQAASTAVWLATLPNDGPSGGFFRDKRLIAW